MSAKMVAFVLAFAGAIAAILTHPRADTSQNDTNSDTGDSPVMDTIKNTAADVTTALWGTPYDDLINTSAVQYGVPPQVLYNLLHTESHFRQDIIDGTVRSPTGAMGIAQFEPATAREELGSEEAALDPNIAIPGAARYLAKLIAKTGSIKAGVAAYDWGVGNVLRKGLSSAPRETLDYIRLVAGDYANGA